MEIFRPILGVPKDRPVFIFLLVFFIWLGHGCNDKSVMKGKMTVKYKYYSKKLLALVF